MLVGVRGYAARGHGARGRHPGAAEVERPRRRIHAPDEETAITVARSLEPVSG